MVVVFCLGLQMQIIAQAKKPTVKPATAQMSDIEKMLKDLPPEERAMAKKMIGKVTGGTGNIEDAKSNSMADDWNKAQQDAAAAIGTLTTKSVGSAGGIVKSTNGKITLNIPAGALAANTTIGIKEIENTAPLSCGNSFKLTPDGQTFLKPVSLTIKYTHFDIESTTPEALRIATQSDGIWIAHQKTEVNIAANTIALPIKHFSDWGVVAFFKILMIPVDKELGRGQSVNFNVTTYKEVADKKAKWEEDFLKKLDDLVDELDKDETTRNKDEELTKQEWKEYQEEAFGGDPDLVPLIRESPKTTQRHVDQIGENKIIELLKKAREVKQKNAQIADVDLVPLLTPKQLADKATDERLLELLKQLNKFKGLKITGWKMNGAPANISNEMGSLTIKEYGAATYKAPQVVPLLEIRSVAISCEMKSQQSGAKFILVSHVLLSNNGWCKATVDGAPWFAHQLFYQKYIANIKSKNRAEIKSADAIYIDEPAEFKGLMISIANGFSKSMVLRIKDPHFGANNIDCTRVGTALFMEEWAGLLTSFRREMRGNTCEEVEICNKLTVNLTALNLKNGGLVEGNFSGSLFGGENGCVNSLEHKVAGSFSLSVSLPSAAKDFLKKNNIKVPAN